MSRYIKTGDFASWGRVSSATQHVGRPKFRSEIAAFLEARKTAQVLAVGMRRSYGTSVSNADGVIIEMLGLDRFITFDKDIGLLVAEGGVTLDSILNLVVPYGWFLPVTPGTQFVTLGGAIANDVHGKNHHTAGTFGRHVRSLGLVRGDGSRLTCSPTENAELFRATIAGLGLTGVVEWAEIQLQKVASSFLDVEVIPFSNLTEFWELADNSAASCEHSVSWIDCTGRGSSLGRGIFSRANWHESGEHQLHKSGARLSIPFDAPRGLLNKHTITVFNRVYRSRQAAKAGQSKLHYGSFFYPLDSLQNWNRLYGSRGFWQYQCVLPPDTMKSHTGKLLSEIADSGQGSFLAVLKTFGPQTSPGMLSFPMEGTTLALDFPNLGPRTRELLDRLDTIVHDAGGKLYAAKDGRISKEMWENGYPALDRFRDQIDPAFCSDFWRQVS